MASEKRREKVRAMVQSHLEAGEQIVAMVPMTQTGPSPWLTAMFGAIGYAFFYARGLRYYALVATDRGVVRLVRSGATGRLTEKGERWARSDVRVLEWTGRDVWGVLVLGEPDGEVRYNVHRRWRDDTEQFVAALRSDNPATA